MPHCPRHPITSCPQVGPYHLRPQDLHPEWWHPREFFDVTTGDTARVILTGEAAEAVDALEDGRGPVLLRRWHDNRRPGLRPGSPEHLASLRRFHLGDARWRADTWRGTRYLRPVSRRAWDDFERSGTPTHHLDSFYPAPWPEPCPQQREEPLYEFGQRWWESIP